MTEENTQMKESYIPDEEAITFCKKYLETWSKVKAYMEVHPDSTRESALSNSTRYFDNPKIKETFSLMLQDKVMGIDEIIIRIADRARDSSNKQAQLKALELMGKTKGIFLDRTDVTTAGKSISWNQYINSEGDVVKDVRGTSLFTIDEDKIR